MFGTYRYILALMVAIAHLAPMSMVHVGFYAVTAFFTLSGYLMSLVLHERYFSLSGGIGKYMANRLLRVMPSYWVVLAFSVLAVAYAPSLALGIHERMRMPVSLGDWLDNIFVLGITGVDGARSQHNLVPPAWSLSVELVFWLLMPFFLRSKPLFVLWGVLSFSYLALVILTHATLDFRYYSHLAAMLSFFLGAALYMLAKRREPASPVWGCALVGISVLYYVCAPLFFNDSLYAGERWYDSSVLFSGLYLAILLNSITIYALARTDPARVPKPLARLDGMLGHLSYPVFLLHILAALAVSLSLDGQCGAGVCGRSWKLAVYSFPVVNILALILWFGIERPIMRLREKIRR